LLYFADAAKRRRPAAESTEFERPPTVGATDGGTVAMPSRRKQQKPRHVDAEDDDDAPVRPPLDDDDDDVDTGAGEFNAIAGTPLLRFGTNRQKKNKYVPFRTTP